MSDREFALQHLNTIEKKHKDYFEQANLCIMNCVIISNHKPVSVHVVNNNLPPNIANEIETMFWKE